MQSMSSEQKDSTNKLNQIWAYVKKEYKIIKLIGKGSYGEVMKVKSRSDKKTYAIKRIKDVFSCKYSAKQVLREVAILRQLS